MGRYPKHTAPALERLGAPLTQLLKVVSARWSFLVLDGLASGHVRFNALHRHLTGINHKVLIETLRMLQRQGFVHRPTQGSPNRFDSATAAEYRLTETGLELLEWIKAIGRRAEQWPCGQQSQLAEMVPQPAEHHQAVTAAEPRQ